MRTHRRKVKRDDADHVREFRDRVGNVDSGKGHDHPPLRAQPVYIAAGERYGRHRHNNGEHGHTGHPKRYYLDAPWQHPQQEDRDK